MTFEELEKWDMMLSALNAKGLESVIKLAVTLLYLRAEEAEDENENL